ncbi:RNA chaperone Hfq [Bacillus sp. BRMEA1]|uniref:RNA chaperone Hfq n=1 Tax=Neobacillus endophyticus TaxID=2738405 RepID=UPI00156308D5|nr:RNA chaperone Hfq [Neobacillus endophyticus]NRD80972.1 RNA chaperone Hfq [Neobacillus endophyticus]
MEKTITRFQNNIQDGFLNELRKQKLPVTVILTSGFQIKGIITNFDGFTIMINSNGKQQLVYKHAISTFVPSKNVE